jgi:hypothetical protein
MSLNIKDALRSELRPNGQWRSTKLLFLCKCGKEIWVRNDVKSCLEHSGKCRSCANRLKGRRFYPGQILPWARKRPYEWLYNYLQRNSTSRHVPFALTFEEFVQFTSMDKCHYCRSKVPWSPHNSNSRVRVAYNLDRKENALGYTKNNLVVCCTFCNLLKRDLLSYEEMTLLGPTLRIIQQRRLV